MKSKCCLCEHFTDGMQSAGASLLASKPVGTPKPILSYSIIRLLPSNPPADLGDTWSPPQSWRVPETQRARGLSRDAQPGSFGGKTRTLLSWPEAFHALFTVQKHLSPSPWPWASELGGGTRTPAPPSTSVGVAGALTESELGRRGKTS